MTLVKVLSLDNYKYSAKVKERLGLWLMTMGNVKRSLVGYSLNPVLNSVYVCIK